MEHVVIVVFTPEESTPAVLRALSEAGAGAIGDYGGCSWSVTGAGRFTPLDGANPTIGAVGEPEIVAEDRIEVVCPRTIARRAVLAMLDAHPYEEPAYHVYPMLRLDDL